MPVFLSVSNLRIVFACGGLLLLQSCAIAYYTQAITGQLDVMARRQPIAEVLADPEVDEATKTRLRAVVEIRDYAVAELQLPENGSYRSYADLDGPYVVWNVVATPEFSLQPQTWCFPVAGCVSYRGYFKQTGAQRFADKLSERGFDVMIGGVPAYSTLGRFEDPLLNTVLVLDDARLAAIIFHELAHQRVYIKGDTAFNEAFATAVAEAGTQAWLEQGGQSELLERYRGGLRRQAEFVDLINRQRARLRALYKQPLDDVDKRREKSRLFDNLRREYAQMNRSRDGDGGYDAWFAQPLNNAHLSAIASYRDWVPAFSAILDDAGGDWQRFHTRVEEIAAMPATERTVRLREAMQ